TGGALGLHLCRRGLHPGGAGVSLLAREGAFALGRSCLPPPPPPPTPPPTPPPPAPSAAAPAGRRGTRRTHAGATHRHPRATPPRGGARAPAGPAAPARRPGGAVVAGRLPGLHHAGDGLGGLRLRAGGGAVPGDGRRRRRVGRGPGRAAAHRL